MLGYRSVCTAHSAAALVGGTLVLFIASPLATVLGLGTAAGTLLAVRMIGSILFALGATLLVAREITDRQAQVRLMIGNLVCDLVLTLLFATSALSGAVGPAVWGLAVLFGVNAGSWVAALSVR